MNKNQVTGRYEEAKGKVKEVTGKTFGNEALEQKGIIQNARGKARADAGDLEAKREKAGQTE